LDSTLHDPSNPATGVETGSLGDVVPKETTLQLASISNTESVLPKDEDVGLPKDGEWSCIAAHESRFCFVHEEWEWLLQSDDRWMSPADFKVSDAETALAAKLQKYALCQGTEKRHRHPPQADCGGGIWSHVDTPIQEGEVGGNIVYLIRWKFCWTRESDIGDMGWVLSSFQEQNKRSNRRHSGRIQTTPEMTAKMKQMMRVYNIR
jgi:hypothetical protein